MARILVVYPQRGLLDLIKQVLKGVYEVDFSETFKEATELLVTRGSYETVLCGVRDPVAAIRFGERVSRTCSGAHLVPVAREKAEVESFREQWRSEENREFTTVRLSPAWLPDPCTAAEILKIVGGSTEQSNLDLGPSAEEPTPTERSLRAGDVVDGYRLLFVIGQGGFGTTWLCLNESTGKRFALKFVEGDGRDQELSALRKYVHVADRTENLIPIRHINGDEASLWFVTPLADSVTGGNTASAYRPLSLGAHLDARGHLPEAEAVAIAASLARALRTLHEANLLHGDVSPANVLSVCNTWVLADPGLVRFLGENGPCRNRRYYPNPVVVRTADDLYALGLVLWDMTSGIWEMLSGKERLAFDKRMLRDIAAQNPFARVLCRVLSEDPHARYANAGEMLQDLESLAPRCLEPGSEWSVYRALQPFRVKS